MQQLDLFDKSPEFYLYSEHQKFKTSCGKQLRAIFALLYEQQKKLNDIEEKYGKLNERNAM